MSKWFTVATEGQTTDGRVIERAWLSDIAATYDRAKFGARIWLEHIRGILPDSPFKAYGDVLAVRTQDNKDGKLELQAQIDPTPELVAMSKARQKIYTSIEIEPDFAKTGRCGLIGLGVTDSPASLGTSVLEFAARNPSSSPLAGRKQSPNNLFTSALETTLDFSEEPTAPDGSAPFFKAMGDFFRSLTTTQPPQAQQPIAASQQDAAGALLAFTQFEQAHREDRATLLQAIKELKQELSDFKQQTASAKELEDLRSELDKTPIGFNRRPIASGGSGDQITDC